MHSNTNNPVQEESENMRSQMNLAGFRNVAMSPQLRPITIKIPTKREYAEADSTLPDIVRTTPMRAVVINYSHANNQNSPEGRQAVAQEDIVPELYGPKEKENDDDFSLSIGPSAKRLSLSPQEDSDDSAKGDSKETLDDVKEEEESENEECEPSPFIGGIMIRPNQTYRTVYIDTKEGGAFSEPLKKKIDNIMSFTLAKIFEFCDSGRTDGCNCVNLALERNDEESDIDTSPGSKYITFKLAAGKEMESESDEKTIILDIPATMAAELPEEIVRGLNEKQLDAFNNLFCHVVRRIFLQFGAARSDHGVMARTMQILKSRVINFKLRDFVDENSAWILRETMQNKKRLDGRFSMEVDERCNTLDFCSSITVYRAYVLLNNKYVFSVSPHSYTFHFKQPDYHVWDGVVLLTAYGQMVYFSKSNILSHIGHKLTKPDKIVNL